MGRTELQKPPELPDAWASDRALRESVAFHLGGDLFHAAENDLAAMGRLAADPATLAMAARAETEPPVHVPYGPWGERIDDIVVSDSYLALGRIGVVAGVTALPYEETPYGELARVVWAALLTMWGPSSALYSCPVAMTDAAARTLLVYGDEEDLAVAKRLTSRDPEVAWTSGQWMTETAGGSDVGRTATIARKEGDVWRLYGTKWFTSATTSEMALTLARPEGGAGGSSGLALFRVHRRLDDGTPNAIMVRRLKDKLGTRALPTAELELHGAVAYPVGGSDPAEGRGVPRIATMLNVTRVHNAVGAAAALARGLAWARSYARVREVFGRPLHEMPAHRATLADLAVDHAASLALVMRCCELMGRAEAGVAAGEELAALRGLTPVAKLATARWAVAGVAEAMEAVGGVGYCEDSTLPALVRNTHVMPIWEGTTNVLALDLLRAESRAGSATVLAREARDAAAPLVEERAVGPPARVVVEAAERLLQRCAENDPEGAEATARPLAMSLARTYACSRLCVQGAWASARGEGRTSAAAAHLAARGLLEPERPPDPGLAMDDLAWAPPRRS